VKKELGVVLLLLAALPIRASAQDDVQRTPPPIAGEDTIIPGPLGEGSLAFDSELARTNYLDGGMSLGTTFDDNALNTSEGRISNLSFLFQPYIALKQSRGRLNWMLDYGGGFTVNQRLSAQNQGSHNLGLEAKYRLSPHIDLLVRDHFVMTTGFFNQLDQNLQAPAGTVLQRPNEFVVTPLAQQTSNLGTAQITFQFSSRSEIGGSGTFYLSHYKNAPEGASLVDSNSQQADAFYNYRISQGSSVGVTYRFQRLTSTPTADTTVANSVLATYTLHLQPASVILSFFAGPQYTDTSTPLTSPAGALSVSQRSWSPAAGGSLNWNGERTSFLAEAAHTASDGGGLYGTVQLTMVDASVRHQFTRTLTVQLGGAYGLSDPVGVAFLGYSALKNASGSFAVSRRLGTSMSLTTGYSYVNQLQQNTVPATAAVHHNRAWISVSYGFTRPLGR